MNLKNKIQFVILSATLGFSTISYALETHEVEYKNMEQMIGSIRLEKKQVESMIDKMIISGRLSNEEGLKAKREIASVKEDDLENLKTLALSEVKK